MKTNPLRSIGLRVVLAITLLLPCSCASIFSGAKAGKGDRWVSLAGGVAPHQFNSSSEYPIGDSRRNLPEATLKMGGVTLGGRSPALIGDIIKVRTELFYFMSDKISTSKGVGEFTDSIQQILFGIDTGINFTDYFYVTVNPIPYLNASLVQGGNKIRNMPGRTTDLKRTWDGAFSVGAGVDIKLGHRFSIGAMFKRFIVLPFLYGPDSGGTAYRTDLYTGVARFYF